jgi:hypothetical protein
MQQPTANEQARLRFAMAEDTIEHFSDPGHELVKRHYVGPFICDRLRHPRLLRRPPSDAPLAGSPPTPARAHPDRPRRDHLRLRGPLRPGLLPLPLPALRLRHAPALRAAASACRHSAGQRTWFYRCSACSLDLHASCAAAAGRVHRHDVHGELVRARISVESQMRVCLVRKSFWF